MLKNTSDSQFLRIERKQKGGKRMFLPELKRLKGNIIARQRNKQEQYAPKHPKLIIIENDGNGRIGVALDTKRALDVAATTVKAVKGAAEYAASAARGIGMLALGKRLVIEADMVPGTEMAVTVDYDFMKAKMNANEMKVLRYLASNGKAGLGELSEKNGISRREAFNAARLLERRKLAEVNGETATYSITDTGIRALSYHASMEYRLSAEDKVRDNSYDSSVARTSQKDENSTLRAGSILRHERRERSTALSAKDEGA